jgi:hypothetical protein
MKDQGAWNEVEDEKVKKMKRKGVKKRQSSRHIKQSPVASILLNWVRMERVVLVPTRATVAESSGSDSGTWCSILHTGKLRDRVLFGIYRSDN